MQRYEAHFSFSYFAASRDDATEVANELHHELRRTLGAGQTIVRKTYIAPALQTDPDATERELDHLIDIQVALLPIQVEHAITTHKAKETLRTAPLETKLDFLCQVNPEFAYLCQRIHDLNLQDQINKGQY